MQCSLLDISLQLQDNPHFPRSCHTVFFAQNNHLAGWFLCRSFLVQTNMHSNQTRETIRVWWRWFVQPWSSTFHFFIYGPIEANRLFSHLSSSWTETIFSLILLVSRKNKMKRRLLCKRTTRENSCFVIVYLCWRIEAHHFLQHAASRITSPLERVENTLGYEKATILVWGRA